MVEVVLLIQQLIASVTHILAKELTISVEPSVALFFRSVIASICFIAWLIFNRTQIKKVIVKDYFTLFILSLINVPINQFLFLISIKFTTPPNVALAYALAPIFVFGIAIIFLKESATLKKILGTILAVAGAIVLLSEHGFDFSSLGFRGDILALAASISWAIYTILNKNFARKYGATYSTALTSIGGTLLYLPIFYFFPVHYNINEISSMNWLQLLYLGIFTSAIAYAMWNWGLTKTDASKIAVFNNLQTIFTTLLSIIFLGYYLSLEFMIGGSMIIVGIYLTQKS